MKKDKPIKEKAAISFFRTIFQSYTASFQLNVITKACLSAGFFAVSVQSDRTFDGKLYQMLLVLKAFS